MASSLRFRDFVPQDQTKFLGFRRKYESFEQLLERVDLWLEKSGVELVNVETVVLPGAPAKRSVQSNEIEMTVGSFGSPQWHQLIRIWYRGAPSEAPSNER